MTRTEQERLVERYLNGEMNSADEQEFFIQVAVDNNLRQTLKAYRIVESAIRKHRDAVPSRHAELRSKVVDMLKVTSVAQAEPAITPPVAPMATIAPAAGRATVSSTMFRWIIAAVAALGFTVAGFVVASFVGTAPEETTPSSGAYQQQGGAAGASKAPAAEATPSSRPQLQQSQEPLAPVSSEQRSSAEGISQSRNARPQQATRTSSATTVRKPASGQPRQGEEQPAQVATTATQPPSPSQQDEPSFSKDGSSRQEPVLQRKSTDTMKVKIQFGTPKDRRQ